MNRCITLAFKVCRQSPYKNKNIPWESQVKSQDAVGGPPRPLGEALGFDPITSTLIFGGHDAVLVDAMMTGLRPRLSRIWFAVQNRNLEAIYNIVG